MAAANGGSFKDGFIGGAIGFGTGLVFAGPQTAAGGMPGLAGVAVRTTIAAIGGGIGSKLSGGSFSDGAYSAAFFHLFNQDLEEIIGTQHATLEYRLSSEPAWEDAVTITPLDSGGWMAGASSALGVASMIPGPIGMIAGVLEVGVALLNGDMASAGWALFGAAAALVGAGAAVKGFRAFRAARAAKRVASAVPQHSTDVLTHVRANGSAPAGFKGGRTFLNDGRGGGQVLPRADAVGNPITYREWDVNAYQKGVNRGAERVVTGSDGRAYYTNDHYGTFTPIE